MLNFVGAIYSRSRLNPLKWPGRIILVPGGVRLQILRHAGGGAVNNDVQIAIIA